MEVERGKAILQELRGSVESMQAVYSSNAAPLSDDDTALQTFCIALESALRHGQKERSSLFGGSKDYWHYFKAGLTDSRAFHDILQAVQTQVDLKTPIAQGRAFLRHCLVEGCLADAVQLCSSGNSKLTSDAYKQDAILRDATLVSTFLDIAYGLSEMRFNLGLVDLNLDQSWPTFAKKVFLGRTPPRNRRTSKPRKPKAALIADSGSDADEPLHDSLASGFIHRSRQESTPETSRAASEATASTAASTPDALGEERQEVVEADSTALPVDAPVEVAEDTSCAAGIEAQPEEDSVPAVQPSEVCDEGVRGGRAESGASDSLPDEAVMTHVVTAEVRERHYDQLIPLLQAWLLGTGTECQPVEQELSGFHAALIESRQQLVDELSRQHEVTVNDLTAERARLSQQCAGLTGDLTLRKEEASGLCKGLDEARAAHRTDAATWTEKCQQLESQHKESAAAAEDALLGTREKLLASEAVVQRLEGEKEQLQSQVKGFGSHQVEMDTMQLQVRSHASEMERYRQELASLREASKREAEEWRERVASTERHHQQQLTAAKERSEDLRGRLKQLSGQLASESVGGEVNGVTREVLVQSVSDEQDVVKKIQFQLSAQAMQLQHASEELTTKKRELEALQYQVLHARQLQDGMEAKLKTTVESRDSLRVESASLSEEVRILSESAASLKSEIVALEGQLIGSNKERDLERVTNLKLNSQLEQFQQVATAMEKQIAELRDELDVAKNQLLAVTRQKAKLVNRQATLEEELSHAGPKQWVEDDQATQCMKCQSFFTLFNRRHHCRSCGKVFCTECCSKTFLLSSSNKPSRVCVPCYERLTGQQRPDRSNTTSPENFVIVTEGEGAVVPPVVERRASDEALARRTAGGKIVLGDSGDEEDSRELLTSDPQDCASGGPTSFASGDGSPRVSGSPYSSASSIAYTSHVAAPSKSLSRQTSRASLHSRKAPEAQPQVLEMLELPIKPGCYHTIPVLIDLPGTRISWQFQTEPKGVAFGIAFKASEVVEGAAATTLTPLRRTGSHKQMVSGDWVAQQAGIYTLQFDNTSSTVTSCRISYRVIVKPAE